VQGYSSGTVEGHVAEFVECRGELARRACDAIEAGGAVPCERVRSTVRIARDPSVARIRGSGAELLGDAQAADVMAADQVGYIRRDERAVVREDH
jgi:hypothetical protein